MEIRIKREVGRDAVNDKCIHLNIHKVVLEPREGNSAGDDKVESDREAGVSAVQSANSRS